jgi:hypothetical protein
MRHCGQVCTADKEQCWQYHFPDYFCPLSEIDQCHIIVQQQQDQLDGKKQYIERNKQLMCMQKGGIEFRHVLYFLPKIKKLGLDGTSLFLAQPLASGGV